MAKKAAARLPHDCAAQDASARSEAIARSHASPSAWSSSGSTAVPCQSASASRWRRRRRSMSVTKHRRRSSGCTPARAAKRAPVSSEE